jgi:hypothetical protein
VDIAAITAALAGQQAQTQLALAAKFARMNADNAKSVAELVDAASRNLEKLANLAAAVGQDLDISA